jgi:hypothetical protein
VIQGQADAVFWAAAALHVTKTLEGSGLIRLQIQLMQLLYALYNPNAGRESLRGQAKSGVWELAGAAVRSAVDLGLHHEHRQIGNEKVDYLEVDMRRRLFWT